MYTLLKPREYWINQANEGFEINEISNFPAALPENHFQEVLMALTLVGLLGCGKLLPPQLNLVLEIEFADHAEAVRGGQNSSVDYELQNVRVLASQVTLDSALVESFNRVLLSGRSLVFSYPTVHTQVTSVPAGSTEFNVTVARAYTKLLGAFVTFRNAADQSGVVALNHPAVLAVLAAGAAQNAPEWAGQTTFELLVGASTLRRLHVTAPLSISLQNEDLALSLACDSYSTAQADAAIAAAITAALLPYPMRRQRSETQQLHRSDARDLVECAGVDRESVHLGWELLKGTNVLRNLHFAGPLLASLQNNTDTAIECDAYDKSETFTQAEVNTVVSSAIDALNITQYQTQTDVDAEIAANSFNGSDYYTKTQSDSRYFVSNANAGNISLIRNAVISTLTDSNSQIAFEHQRHPSGTALELTCDAYTRSEADSRHIQSGNLT
ncbi:unnamed protein product, partial [Symbiodinium microadriaticum]